MRTIVRSAVIVVVSLVLAAPASARQLIAYEGTTSAPTFHRVRASVVKQDDGDRKLKAWRANVEITCEDMSTQRWRIGFGGYPLGPDGEFDVESLNGEGSGIYIHGTGSLRWGRGSGTLELNVPALTADGQDAQLCTSGDLTWTVNRVIPPTETPPPAVPDGVGVLELRVRHGVAEVVKLVEP